MATGKQGGRQPKTNDKTRIHMALPTDLVEAMDKAASKRGISRTLYIVAACRSELERGKAQRRA